MVSKVGAGISKPWKPCMRHTGLTRGNLLFPLGLTGTTVLMEIDYCISSS